MSVAEQPNQTPPKQPPQKGIQEQFDDLKEMARVKQGQAITMLSRSYEGFIEMQSREMMRLQQVCVDNKIDPRPPQQQQQDKPPNRAARRQQAKKEGKVPVKVIKKPPV